MLSWNYTHFPPDCITSEEPFSSEIYILQFCCLSRTWFFFCHHITGSNLAFCLWEYLLNDEIILPFPTSSLHCKYHFFVPAFYHKNCPVCRRSERTVYHELLHACVHIDRMEGGGQSGILCYFSSDDSSVHLLRKRTRFCMSTIYHYCT